MKSRTLFIIIFITTSLIQAQSLTQNDSIAILFKGQLFTISEYGVASKDKILKDIENQKSDFLKTKYENFLFMKITFNQPYRLLNQNLSTLVRNCDYYIAFNIKQSRYYKLGGFNKIDIADFFDDLKINEKSLFPDGKGEEIKDVDIHCLYNYYRLSEKKRNKSKFDCFGNCQEKTSTTIIIH